MNPEDCENMFEHLCPEEEAYRRGLFEGQQEIERYQKALEWVANHEDDVILTKWKNADGYGITRIPILAGFRKIRGEGPTPLEAIEAAMKEGK